MKKEKFAVFILLTLFLATSAFAMTGSVVVKTEPGNTVRLYIWPIEPGPLINNAQGIANDGGIFSAKFFSWKDNEAKLNVKIFNENNILKHNVDFEKPEITKSLLIECAAGSTDKCIIQTIEIGSEPTGEEETNKTEEVTEVLVEEVTKENTTETTEETITIIDEETPKTTAPVTGKSIFKNTDNSLDWVSILSGAAVLFVFFTLLVGISMHKHGKKKKPVVVSPVQSNDELTELENRIKAKEAEIKSIKEAREKRNKIIQAKLKLSQDEKELDSLKKEDQGKVSEAKEKLEAKEKELEHLKGQRE